MAACIALVVTAFGGVGGGDELRAAFTNPFDTQLPHRPGLPCTT